jgi:hypothetical protein
MSSEHRSDELEVRDSARTTVAGASRRQMLRHSLGAAAPVVTTFASLPVSAGTCAVASSYVSAATFASRNPGTSSRFACTISTRSSILTAQNSYCNSTKFGDVFADAPSSGLSFSSSTKIKDVLMLGDSVVGGETEVAWRLVWLHMNLRQGAMGDMPADYAQKVWHDYKSNGNSYVANGVTWNSAQLISYLTFVLG